MARVETRLHCPVCLGIKMEKAKLGRGKSQLVLDHCGRCGGVWFELGEVQRLRSHQPELLWQRVPRRDYEPRVACHACHAPMSRTTNVCAACGHDHRLQCPHCRKPMQVAQQQGLSLDVCKHCKGVWFDHAELAAIWQIELNTAMQNRAAVVPGAVADGGGVLLEALWWSPDLMFFGAHAAGHALGAAGHVVAEAPGLIAAAGEVVADAAGAVFEAIVALLEGLG